MMFKTKSFRAHRFMEESLARDVAYFLNNNHINRENIVDIKYTVNNDWLYCMLIWEDN